MHAALIIRVYSDVAPKPISFTATCVRSGGDVRFPAWFTQRNAGWCMRRARRIGAWYYRAIRLRKYRVGIGITHATRRCDRVCLRTLTHPRIHAHTFARSAHCKYIYTRLAYARILNGAVILSAAAARTGQEVHTWGERVVQLYCKSRSSSPTLIRSLAQLLQSSTVAVRALAHPHTPSCMHVCTTGANTQLFA